MLDKSNEKNVGQAETGEVKAADTVKEPEAAVAASVPERPEAAGSASMAEEPEAAVAASVPEEPEAAGSASMAGESGTDEAVSASEGSKAVVTAEEPRITGYRSELDGIEVDFELQYRDQETDMKDIAKRVAEDYARRGNDASGIGLIQVYLKPTDYTAYYVINNSYEGKIPLF